MNPIELQEQRQWRKMLPFLAGPGTAVVCLDDGERGTILEISEMAGHLAYLVQMEAGPMRFVLATDLDSAAMRSQVNVPVGSEEGSPSVRHRQRG